MKKSKIVTRILSGVTALLVCASVLFSCAVPETMIPGDCNGDGTVNAVDSNLICRLVSGETVIVSLTNADLNSDGVDSEADKNLLFKYLCGTYLPGQRFSHIILNGTDISKYVIVVPKNSSDFEKWTAQILADTVESLSGAKLDIQNDSKEEKTYEILIGNTSRKESEGQSAEEGKYLLFSKNMKIVLKGNDYFVAGGAGEIIAALENSTSNWNMETHVEVGPLPEQREVKWEKPENTFLFIGDGMGLNHTKMATDENPLVEYAGETLATPDESGCNIFWPSTFENIGKAVTLNIQESTTDSAAGATALSTGYKTLNGALGMIPADLDGDGEENEFRSVQNVREAATLRGKATAVVSTDKQTGATPNAFLVHHTSRKDRDIILEQQTALDMTRLACNYVWCSYDSNDVLENFIEAVDTCDDNPGGFFIMTEEAMIDKFGEKMDYDNVIRTVKRLNTMTAYAATYAMCHRDTVIVITADHETGGLTYGEDEVWRWTSNGEHTSINVPVFAMGQGTEIFNDTACDNTDIADFLFETVRK